uniref:GTPase HflX n=1 Tax=Methanomethylophilus alvi TaxID=1291540 RepID=UPI0037DDE084
MDTTFSVAERDDDGTVEGRERVILIGLDTSVTSGWDMEETMEELESLVDTAGGVVVGQVIQRRQKPDPAYFIGKGKAEEVELMREAFEAELIVFNDELGPAQQRNLESVINAKVIDRTQLILDIFAQRAETAEGKLQVELAQLQYLLPRLTGKGTVLSRLGGGIGTRGPGETKLEMDKRVIRGRIADIKEQIEDVRKRRGVQRSKRQEANIPVLSLVGYTNAGKSSLLNKVTGADVFVEDKLFATLDPVTRK